MKIPFILIPLVAILGFGFFTCKARATDIDFYSDGIINEPDTYLNVGIWNDVTVDMFGGSVTNDLAVNDQSTFNLWGGLAAEIYNRSIVNIYGGEVSLKIATTDSGTTNIYDGIITCSVLFYVSTATTLNIYGGNIDISNCSFYGDKTVNIYGYDFNYNPALYVLTGFLADDNPFTLNGVDNDEYARINFVPEPASVLLFGLAGLALLRKRGAFRSRMTADSTRMDDMGAYELPRIWFVDSSATEGQDDGTSWTDARIDLQDALTIDAEADDEIWVAAGTYYPYQGPTPEQYRSETFQLLEDVPLYGGFAGTETALTDRNWTANETTLSGDIDQTDVDDYLYNSYHVVKGADNAIIDGFTIEDGYANGSGNDIYGGGMLNIAVSPSVVNCVFGDNVALVGGAMFNSESFLSVKRSTFEDNFTTSFGGAIVNLNCSSSQTIENCIFNGNVSYYYDEQEPYYSGYGGAIYNEGSSPTIANSTFYDNGALLYGGAVLDNQSSCSTIMNCILWDDWSSNGNEIAILNSSTVTVSYTDVKGGSGGVFGGALVWGDGNIDAGPLFADVDNGDFHVKSVDGRWNGSNWVTDSITSPCINGGDPASDYSKEPAPNGSRINMGTYGNTPYASKIQPYQITINLTATDGQPLVDNPAWYITYKISGNYYYYDGVARYSGNQVSLASGTYYAYCENTETDCQAPYISDCEFAVGGSQPSSYDMTYRAWGSLRVTLMPSTARWRPVGDTTWYSSGYSKNLTAYGDNSPTYGIEFEPHLGYDTPSILGGIHIYRGQETAKNVIYDPVKRYISPNGNNNYNGKTVAGAWETIDYAIHAVDEVGGGTLYFDAQNGTYEDSLQASDFYDLNYMTNCYHYNGGVYISASRSVFPSQHVSFTFMFSFDQ